MASSTARPEPRIETMPARIETMSPARIAQMDEAIAALQAQGAEVTAAAVHRRVSGHRRTVQVYVKTWHQALA